MLSSEDAEFDSRFAAWQEWDREDRARRWLANNTRRASFLRLSNREILRELRSVVTHSDPGSLLDALCEMVGRKNGRFQRSVASILASLAAEHPGPGPDAVAVDRAIRRLLHRLSDPPGRPVALECLRSARRVRRGAAFKFYRSHGTDEESRPILAADFPTECDDEYRKLVAEDADLVFRIGARTVADVASNRYWRSRVIESVLVTGADGDELRDAYPAEWLWAAARRHDHRQIRHALALLRANPDNTDLVNRVVLCLTELGDRAAIDEALVVAQHILDKVPGRPPGPWEGIET